jgi:hypothetical protein
LVLISRAVWCTVNSRLFSRMLRARGTSLLLSLFSRKYKSGLSIATYIDYCVYIYSGVSNWRPALQLLDENNGVAWNLIVKLVSGSKSSLKLDDLVEALDRPAPIQKKSSISNILQSPLKMNTKTVK